MSNLRCFLNQVQRLSALLVTLVLAATSLTACGTHSRSSGEAGSAQERPGMAASVFPLDKSVQKGEDRQLAPFSKIDANGHGDLVVTVDASKPQAVRVEANGKSLSGVSTEVSDSTLRVKIANGINPDVVRIVITVPSLTELNTGGAFHATVDLGDSKAVAMQISGATNMTILGRAQKLSLVISGASMVVARSVKTSICTATVSGASSASLDGSKEVAVTASGASHVTVYTGAKPGKISQKCSGASRIDVNSEDQF